MNTTKSKYYHCYSINLLRKIQKHNIKYITRGINPSSNKTFWLFEVDEKLQKILDEWKNNKP